MYRAIGFEAIQKYFFLFVSMGLHLGFLLFVKKKKKTQFFNQYDFLFVKILVKTQLLTN